MQDANQLRLRKRGACRIENGGIADFEILVALRQSVEVQTVCRIGEKDL